MMDINPADLRYFFETAKTLNISRAAERLNIGQPALSQSIRRLEEVIGVKLFDRFKTGVQLTAAGRRLLHEGRIAIENWEHLKSAVLASDLEIVGRYSIGCHIAVGIYSLPHFMRTLLDKYPQLEITLVHGLSRDIVESIISFRVDFGLVMNPVRHPDLIIKELCDDKVSIWQSPQSVQNTLIYDPSLSQAQLLIKKLGMKTAYKRHLHSSSLEVIAKLAGAGCGDAILPERVAKQQPNLSLKNKETPFVTDKLYLAYRADRHITAASRVIIDSILKAKI
jgi:DNA-binding transcriptional LysR family regulator